MSPLYLNNPFSNLGPQCLYPGDQGLAIGTLTNLQTALSSAVGETVGAAGGAATTGAFSQEFVLGSLPEAYPPSVRVQLKFSVNPGAFNFQVQESDTPEDPQSWVTIAGAGTLTAAVATADGVHYIATSDLVPVKGRAVRLYCNSQPANACNVIGIISR